MSKSMSLSPVQDVLKTSCLQKKARLIEKVSQGEPKAPSADHNAVFADRLAMEIALTENLMAAIHATAGQSQNTTLRNLLLEAEAVQVL